MNVPQKSIIILGSISLLLLGVGIGIGISKTFLQEKYEDNTGHTLRLSTSNFPLIKPLLACNIDAQKPSAAYGTLQVSLASAVDAAVAAGNIEKAAIYVRSLNDGAWTAVNGDEEYIPGSLMKIVTLIGYLNEAENTPSILDEMLTVNPEYHISPQNIPPTWFAEPGKQYSVSELLRFMIVSSDNAASYTLIEHMRAEALNGLLSALKIPNFADESTIYQHHDCGIIYTENPYVLCVMTQGKTLQTLAETIAQFTAITHTYMQNQ